MTSQKRLWILLVPKLDSQADLKIISLLCELSNLPQKKKSIRNMVLKHFNLENSIKKLCCLFKLHRYQSPIYLFNILPTERRCYHLRNSSFPTLNLRTCRVKHNFFKRYFLLYWLLNGKILILTFKSLWM